ncbi:MAG: Zn-ribbon domain-containing OB-fold protein [Actinobacteria bacterium]|nr:Zn-ribbon domain-containing OB-fold protein [Actinomycetota bacterium]MBU2686977.1 Zn-ribbon domain-containing OB-fold protein [Actinomycetota bacterium]
MTEDWRDSQEILVMDGRIKVPYAWSAGEVGTTYLESLRDAERFLGTRCPVCGIVYHLPRMHCPDCFEACPEWVELESTGTLVTWTIARRPHPALSPLAPPFGFGVIRLDGADTGFLHLLYGFGVGSLRSGMRVEAVFARERTGSILDVSHFRPSREVV